MLKLHNKKRKEKKQKCLAMKHKTKFNAQMFGSHKETLAQANSLQVQPILKESHRLKEKCVLNTYKYLP